MEKDCRSSRRKGEAVREVPVSRSDEQARMFISAAATKCPKCHKEDLDFAGVQIEGQSVHQEASCHDCETQFYVIYRLVGFGVYLGGATEVHTIAEDFKEITSLEHDRHDLS